MKLKTVLLFTGWSGALIANSEALAAPTLTVVSVNTTNSFLVANGLTSAVIGVTGFAPGERLLGFIGNAENPWTIHTLHPNGFFNVDSTPYFDGQGQTAGNGATAPPNGQWDTGVLSNPTTIALGMISSSGLSNPIGFAQFGVNHNSGPGTDVSWLSSNSEGIQVTGTANLLRLTFANSWCVFCNMTIVTNTAGQLNYYPGIIFLPHPGCIPAPGALALFGVIAIVGKRRRRV